MDLSVPRIQHLTLMGAIGAGKTAVGEAMVAELKHKGFCARFFPEPIEEMKPALKQFYEWMNERETRSRVAATGGAGMGSSVASDSEAGLIHKPSTATGPSRHDHFVFYFQSVMCSLQMQVATAARSWATSMLRGGETRPIVILQERCVIDALCVFFPMSCAAGHATHDEAKVLEAMAAHQWVPDGIVFVDTDPDTCVARVMKRIAVRQSEKTIHPEYIKGVVNKYRAVLSDPTKECSSITAQWLLRRPVFRISNNDDGDRHLQRVASLGVHLLTTANPHEDRAPQWRATFADMQVRKPRRAASQSYTPSTLRQQRTSTSASDCYLAAIFALAAIAIFVAGIVALVEKATRDASRH